jgi:Spy/CpxP family protein refolding chaperone
MTRILHALSFLLFFAPGLAFAADRYGEIADKLKLEPAQRTQVEDIMYKAKVARTEAGSKLKRAKLEMKHALGADTLDEKAVRKAAADVNAASAALVESRVQQVIAIRKVLSPSQWKDLEQIWDEDGGERRRGGRRRGGGRDGAEGEEGGGPGR